MVDNNMGTAASNNTSYISLGVLRRISSRTYNAQGTLTKGHPIIIIQYLESKHFVLTSKTSFLVDVWAPARHTHHVKNEYHSTKKTIFWYGENCWRHMRRQKNEIPCHLSDNICSFIDDWQPERMSARWCCFLSTWRWQIQAQITRRW